MKSNLVKLISQFCIDFSFLILFHCQITTSNSPEYKSQIKFQIDCNLFAISFVLEKSQMKQLSNAPNDHAVVSVYTTTCIQPLTVLTLFRGCGEYHIQILYCEHSAASFINSPI